MLSFYYFHFFLRDIKIHFHIPTYFYFQICDTSNLFSFLHCIRRFYVSLLPFRLYFPPPLPLTLASVHTSNTYTGIGVSRQGLSLRLPSMLLFNLFKPLSTLMTLLCFRCTLRFILSCRNVGHGNSIASNFFSNFALRVRCCMNEWMPPK